MARRNSRLPTALRRLTPSRERDKAAVFVCAWIASLLALLVAIDAASPETVRGTATVHVTLVIEGGNWTIAYSPSTTNRTVFSILREASSMQGFALEWIDYGWPYEDVLITSINGTRNGTQNRWWQYCVNGEYARVGALHMEVRSGDVVRWVFAAEGGNELCA